VAESWTLTAAPEEEPVTLAEAKAHGRIVSDAEDALIAQLIAAARQALEFDADLALVTQTWDWQLDAWPESAWTWIPRAPLQSVDAITYLDADGVERTLDESLYRVVGSRPGRLGLAAGASWPVVQAVPGAITITLTVGYGAAADVPAAAKAALLLRFGLLYENREAAQEPTVGNGLVPVPLAYQSLVASLQPWIYR
jgi:uncharacterized phiE125 gp8 family phage protein